MHENPRFFKAVCDYKLKKSDFPEKIRLIFRVPEPPPKKLYPELWLRKTEKNEEILKQLPYIIETLSNISEENKIIPGKRISNVPWWEIQTHLNREMYPDDLIILIYCSKGSVLYEHLNSAGFTEECFSHNNFRLKWRHLLRKKIEEKGMKFDRYKRRQPKIRNTGSSK